MIDIQKCPKCGGDLTERPNMFHWRGTSYTGWVCQPCNSMWAKGEGHDRFMSDVIASAKQQF